MKNKKAKNEQYYLKYSQDSGILCSKKVQHMEYQI
jgi:hypothetical protein